MRVDSLSRTVAAASVAGAQGEGLKYLLGQGLIGQRGEAGRTPLQCGEFTVECFFRRPDDDAVAKQQVDSLIQALTAWGLFGGLGSRNRHGLGSVALRTLDVDGKSRAVPSTLTDLSTATDGFKARGHSVEPPFTAFSAGARLDVLKGLSDASRTLEAVGALMQDLRGAGTRVGGPLFSSDTKLVLDVVAGRAASDRHPARVAFGLPHNYFFKKSADKVGIKPAGKVGDRRASPLFLHLHEFASGKLAVVLALLPAQFLPADERIEMLPGISVRRKQDGEGAARKQIVPVDVHNFQAIHELLDAFAAAWSEG